MQVKQVVGIQIIFVFYFLLGMKNLLITLFSEVVIWELNTWSFVAYSIFVFSGVLFYHFVNKQNEPNRVGPVWWGESVSAYKVFNCVCIGVLLSLSVWGLVALQVYFVSHFFSENIIFLGQEFYLSNSTIEFSTDYFNASMETLFFFLVLSVFLGPFIEELYFRRWALETWLKKYNPCFAIILTSLFFALIHNPSFYFSTFIHSIIFSLIYLKYKNFIYSVIVHATYNFAIWGSKSFNLLNVFHSKNSDELNQISTWNFELSLLLFSFSGIALLFNLKHFANYGKKRL